jgi:exopolysaccharide biosynthesis polyprenyl glycosylphosphotransferase
MRKLLLFVGDVIILYISLALTVWIRYSQNFSNSFDLHLLPFSIIFVIWLVVFYITNLYEISASKNGPIFYSDFLRSIIVSLLISVFFFYSLPIYGITPKTNLLIFSAIFFALGFCARYGFNNIFQRSFKKEILIIGLNQHSLDLARFIKANPQLGYSLRHVVDLSSISDQIEEEFKEFGIIKGIDSLKDSIAREKIDAIVISPEIYHIPKIIDLFYRALEKRVNFYDLSSFYERVTGKVALGAINQVWFLDNLSEGSKRGYEVAKRIIDLILAILFGGVSVVIYPIIFLGVKINSPGPIFYKQKRVGQHGRIFEMIKFRTMNVNAETNGAVWAQEDDPRVTGIGKLMRQTRIDELPQVWNILRGEMSFVGPRAERPEFHKQLQDEVPFFEERYLIKPGLTGWAQINYRYGASALDAAEKLKFDLYYIKNRSLLLDLGIILKTARIAFQQAGR